MKREIEKNLIEWKDDNSRKPLIIRGARQVGKSFTIRKFAKEHFLSFIEINFELQPEYCACFESLEPKNIIDRISLLSKTDIIPGETLLFFDEIQLFPKAIVALRYFYERMPHLHIITAGSLLEFALDAKGISVPVGRIEYLFLLPLSFCEFLRALGEDKLAQHVASPEGLSAMGTSGHEHALTLLRRYFLIGGMPQVVAAYISGKQLSYCQRLQSSIVQTYQDDFGKYASRTKHKHLYKVFNAIPKMVGQKIKYSKIDADSQSREIKEAIDLLEKAGVIHKVKQASGEGLPLEASASQTHYKAVFLDVGLMQNMCGLSTEIASNADILGIHSGSVAEQFAAMELLSSQSPDRKAMLYYWAREAASSNAEVDYLIANNSTVVAVEIKAGATGSFRSMNLFLKQYGSEFGIASSQKTYQGVPPVISIPLYALHNWQKLIPLL